jgi:peptide/nickel transport system substrate-binding protein
MLRLRTGALLALCCLFVLSAMAVTAGGATDTTETAATSTAAADFQGLDRDTYATVAEFERLTGRRIAQFNESPMMAELVAEGKLPPVEERLPDQPLVLLPQATSKQVGTYGGTLRLNSKASYMGPTGAEKQHFISAEKEYTQNIFPNLAESFESPDGGKTWIITMRRGLKWSDGTPWTPDDVMFWYEDVVGNKEFQPQTSYVLLTGGAPLVFEKVDQITWKIIADAPYHLEENVEDLMTLPPLYPKEYLKQFHPDYTSSADLDAMVKEGGFTSWVDLLENKTNRWSQNANVDKPVLTPWVLIQGAPAKTEIYHRNPYFHAVDIVGNQLPYFDMVRKEVVADVENAKLRALAGQDDIFITKLLDFFPVAKQEERNGKIMVTRWAHSQYNMATIEFNMTAPDLVLRDIFQNKDFRFGASHAINRELLNELIYSGMLEPQQACESERSLYHNARLCNTAIEYDPAKANQMLDAAGLDKRDSNNWRLRPDGQRLELNMISMVPWALDKTAEIIVDNFKEVGLFTTIRMVEWGHGQELVKNNKIDVFINGFTWFGNEGVPQFSCALGIPCPVTFWAPLWNHWLRSDGQEGERPIPELLQVWDAYKIILNSFDPEERKEQFKIVTDIAADMLWTIGTLSPGGFVVTYNPAMHNIPKEFSMWNRGDNGRPWLWFFE